MEDAAFDNRLPGLRVRGDKVENVNIAVLPDAVYAAKPLLQARRVPRHIVVNHQMAKLEVNTLAGCLGGHANLRLRAKRLLRPLALVDVHAPMNLTRGKTPALQVIADMV